jgi:fumarate reductase flavoprotein subunit
MNGANRLGSNSLTECLVFGARAGRAAAACAREGAPSSRNPLLALALDEERRIQREFLRREDGDERIESIRAEMQEAMESGCGIYRDETSLRATCDRVQGMRERFRRVRLDDHTAAFNTELMAALELDFMLDVAQSVAYSALRRTESRGSHQRTDHPKRDDQRFLRHTLAYRTDGEPRIDYLDVVITRWPPAERVYGGR